MLSTVRFSRLAPLAVTLTVLGVALSASAQPFGVRLTEHADPARSIAVSWNSSRTGDDQVHIGVSPAALDRVVTAGETFAMGAELGTGYTARIDGLEPDTEYYYKVGRAGELYPSGDPFSFRTLPDDRCAPIRILVIGDNRADLDGMGPNPLWPDIMNEALAESPALMINTGDMVKNGERTDEWANFINDSEPGFATVPSIVTMGNHDEDDVNGDGAIFNRLFELPRNSRTATEDYYSIDVGPVHFVSINTQFTRPSTSEMSEMLTWLEEDLSAATQPWTIVFFHKAVYSRGNHHTGEENDGAINAALTPIFDAHDVDLVLNGHSHDYERYAPTVGFDVEFGGTGRTFPAGDGSTVAGMMMIPDGRTGTTYIVTGGAGALTTAGIPGTGWCMDLACTYCLPFVNNCADEVLDNDRDATVQFSGLHNYVVMDVDGPDIHIVAKSTIAGNSGRGGTTLDTFTIANSDWPASICGDDPMPGTDGGVPSPDGGVVGGRDAGIASTRDAGTGGTGSPDAGTGGPGGGPGSGGSDDGGCGCTVPGAPPFGAPTPWVIGALAVALYFRRRRG